MIYHYQLPKGVSAGRAVNTLLRKIKTVDDADRFLIYGAGHLTLAGKLEVILRKYRSRIKTINLWGQGPYKQKTAPRFFKRMIRGMLDYKGSHSKLFRKIIIDPQTPCPAGCQVLQVKDLKLHQKHTLEEIARLL